MTTTFAIVVVSISVAGTIMSLWSIYITHTSLKKLKEADRLQEKNEETEKSKSKIHLNEHGFLHNENGPARILRNGSKEYWLDGKKVMKENHRTLMALKNKES